MTPPPLPNAPQPRNVPTESEIIPFRSKKIRLSKSGILIPGAATAVACLLMYNTKTYPGQAALFAAYLLFAIFYACYAYSGIRKNILAYVIPCLIVTLFMSNPLFKWGYTFFHLMLPGDTSKLTNDSSAVQIFTAFFFGAGLFEELLKAIPALIGMAIAVYAAPSSSSGRGIGDWLKVSTPLEGVLVGVVAGAMFTYLETIGQYVPNAVNFQVKPGVVAGWAQGFWLLLPRLTDTVVGHSGWAAIFGYFIGLSAVYPRSMPKLLVIGWLTSAFLHAFWDSTEGWGLGAAGLWIASAVTLFLFTACFLKAKQLYQAEQGIDLGQSDSIVVGAPSWGPVASPPPPPAPPLIATPAQAPLFALAHDQTRFAIASGQTIDLGVCFPGLGLPGGTLASVSAHPSDAHIVGLKNLTATPWIMTTPAGVTASVNPGQNVRLVDGGKLTIGAAMIAVQSLVAG